MYILVRIYIHTHTYTSTNRLLRLPLCYCHSGCGAYRSSSGGRLPERHAPAHARLTGFSAPDLTGADWKPRVHDFSLQHYDSYPGPRQDFPIP